MNKDIAKDWIIEDLEAQVHILEQALKMSVKREEQLKDDADALLIQLQITEEMLAENTAKLDMIKDMLKL